MPGYAWVCFACETSNAADTDVCGQCGMSASATGHQISAAKAARSSAVSGGQAIPQSGYPFPPRPTAEASPLVAVLLVVFGGVCLVGAVASFTNSHWPVFMPPQLDAVAVPLSWLSEKLGAWVGGALAAVVGVFSIVAGLAGVGRNRAA
jgi:hypothetical protein